MGSAGSQTTPVRRMGATAAGWQADMSPYSEQNRRGLGPRQDETRQEVTSVQPAWLKMRSIPQSSRDAQADKAEDFRPGSRQSDNASASHGRQSCRLLASAQAGGLVLRQVI